MNWKLLLTIALLVIGITLVVMYPDSSRLTPKQKEDYSAKRKFGWAMVIISFALGFYFYYTGSIKLTCDQKANMNGECQSCNQYIQRRRNLNPYSTAEYMTLKNQAAACNTCSQMCEDELKIQQRYPDQYSANVRRQTRDRCIGLTENAIYARNELDRLGSRLRGQQLRLWEGAHAAGGKPTWDPFPRVPVQ